ncbi:MAG: DUF2252 domain-containing protein [Acidimicrobiales bacterium]
MNDERHVADLAARRATGRSARERTSRQSLGQLAERPPTYDAVARLIEQGEHRVASLLPLRYQRMLESPLAFYRGAALLMADDLARGSSTDLEAQICGDAHLSNFGIFSSPERRLVFDVNDFDETETGPFEWDVKRLVSSLVISSEQLGHRTKQQENIARSVAREYRTAMSEFALQTRLQVWYATLDLSLAMKELRGFFSDSAREKVDDIFRGVKESPTTSAFDKVVQYSKNRASIRINPPHFTPLDATQDGSMTEDDVREIVREYVKTLSSDRQVLLGQYVVRDVARHVVGVGSVGTECLAVLLVGRDEYDPLLLQIKEAQASVITQARGLTSAFAPGERVVRGQRLMQATPDLLLGWQSVGPLKRRRSFYIRQLYDNKAAVDVERLNESLLVAYGRVCAWTLARAHARCGHSALLSGYLGKGERFDESMVEFARHYAARNAKDYEELKQAVKDGRVVAAT